MNRVDNANIRPERPASAPDAMGGGSWVCPSCGTQSNGKLRRSQARCQHRLYKLRVETGGWAELAEILSGVRQTASMKR